MFGMIGKFKAQPGRRDELVKLMLGGIDAMPGCLSYVVALDPADADAVWVTEVWDNADSHKASLSIPAVRATIEKAMPLIVGFETSVKTEPVGGAGLAVSQA
jgi:quinol monooxygenase YgiN